MPELNPKTVPEALNILGGLIPGKIGYAVTGASLMGINLGGIFTGLTKVIPKVTSFLGDLTIPKVLTGYATTGTATALAAGSAISAEHIINDKPFTGKDLKQVAAFGLSAPSALYTNFVNSGNEFFSDFNRAAGTAKTSIIQNIQDVSTAANQFIKDNPEKVIAGLAGGSALAAGGYYLANRQPNTGVSKDDFSKFQADVTQAFQQLGSQQAMVQQTPIAPVAAAPIVATPRKKAKVKPKKKKAKSRKKKVIKKKSTKKKKKK